MSTPAAQHRNGRPNRPDRSIVTLVQDLPDLADVAEGTGALSAMERANLAAAEAAIDTFQASGWAAGQALAVIAKGAYHRDTHATFPEYLWERWGLKPSPAYRLMEGWRLAARLAPATAGRGVTGSHVTSLMPVVKQYGGDRDEDGFDELGETTAEAVFAGAQDALQESALDRKLTAVLLDAAVAVLPKPAELPEDQGERVKVVREAAREAVTSLIGKAGGAGDGKEKAKKVSGPLRLAVPEKLAAELDDWTSQLSAGLGMTLSRDAVVARIVELALEEPDALAAVAQRIESESAEKIGTARRWTWTPAGKPRGHIRIAEQKPKGHKAGKGEPEITCAAPGTEPCEEIPEWRVTDHPVGKTATVSTAHFCDEHLPADSSPPGRWNG
ncbi:hypothetical protein ACFV4P_35395 [Kitasatospora sp. NPDC059795]|uniref:hypothetical protein n=1 Tax=Kitasatospora sp. NPDC059795 TaxID=3346949 RepID=UPI003660F691